MPNGSHGNMITYNMIYMDQQKPTSQPPPLPPLERKMPERPRKKRIRHPTEDEDHAVTKAPSASNNMPPTLTPSTTNTMPSLLTPSPSTSNTMSPPSGSNTMPSHATPCLNTSTGSNTIPSHAASASIGPNKRQVPFDQAELKVVLLAAEAVYEMKREQVAIDEDDQFWEDCARQFDKVEEHMAQDKGNAKRFICWKTTNGSRQRLPTLLATMRSGDRHQPTTQQSSHRNHDHNNDRHGSDRRGGGDNHRSNNNYSGNNNMSSSNGRDQRNRGQQSNRHVNFDFQQSKGPSEGYSYPKDCKKNTMASTSGQADKKQGASGRVFAITEDHATKTSGTITAEQERLKREYHSIRQTNTKTSTEFMQLFLRLAGFLGAAAGTEEEQEKNFQWGLRRSTLNHLMCMSYTDVAQVANAARNYKILHERDDDDTDDQTSGRRVGIGVSRPLNRVVTRTTVIITTVMDQTGTSTEFMQRFLRLDGFLGAAAGTAKEQAKNFQWGLPKSTLNHLMCIPFTDVAQVANAARNYEILHERDDDGAEQKSDDRHQPTTQQSSHRNHGHNNDRHGSDRRGGGDNHRSNNNYSGNNNRETGVSSPTDLLILSRGPSEGYSYPVCTTCGRRHPGECHRAAGTCFKCGQNGHLEKDCKKNTAASTSGEADKKPSASGRVFAITEDHATKTSDSVRITHVYRDLPLQFDDKIRAINALPLDMCEFDIILGMDWLTEHHATIDCRSYRVIFGDIHAPEFIYHGSLLVKSMQIISALQARTLVSYGCEGFLATIHDTTSDVPSIHDQPIVSEFPDVFPDELPGIPPVREVEFSIELIPGAEPISKAPYRMAPIELKESIRTSYPHFLP
uniref:CCHC-type domain-containing protein n=1 Tax=Tanacetum cinerariifolium TaxID=118510 RepID=A0A6L2KZ00_TANCI|nr:hypothetical protein [Tanacetum cinerariifolium]